MVKKINLDRFYKIFKSNIFILFLFAFLSVLSSIIMWKSHFVSNSVDIYFHLSRIFEIKDSIVHGNGLPIVAINKFYQSGSAVMMMYPYINLLPVVLFSLFIKSFVHLVYFTFILRNFLSLIIAYFACYSFNKNKWISFIFSISYVLSTMTLFYSFFLMDMGVSTSLIFIPMVLFGTCKLLTDYSWLELSLGFTALLYSHIICFAMSFLFVIWMLLINLRIIDIKRLLISIVKCMIIVMLSTSVFWIPFITLYLTNAISMPVVGWNLSGTNFNDFISFVLNNSLTTNIDGITVRYITPIAFAGIIVGIIGYKHMLHFDKQIFWTSIVSIFVSSSFFPWNLLNDTFVKTTFQFSWRIFIITQVLLCYIFAVNVVKLCKNRKQILRVTVIITLLIICMQSTSQKTVIDTFANNKFDFNHIIRDDQNLYTDYFPKNSLNIKDDINNHQVIYDNDRRTVTSLLGNGKFSFKLDKSSKSVKMPFLIYNDIDYQVKVDGKNTKFYSDKNSQLTLGHINKGKHTVQMIVHKSWYDYLSYVLSALGVVILAFAWIRSLILKRKNK